MDESDQATDREIKDREMLMKLKKPEGPKATGFCLNCEEPLAPNIRWCDLFCQRDWLARQRPQK